ncbi:MAG: HAD hydrolase family protein [Xanthomonadales bacterium]|nr:HAD hydrolase family protein [Xanthomonadales bacterium]NIN59046.1 HAD hydrolase family protein [Xanthomonadales bacterium]NIN74350.1 HAD hydrolase family protein [Xanthomonadales bacterium]NIO13935.1 HAD hydrolase family protein [Xanthomonadales bacterium]NIP11439.1 HAD hydrolase family protein [Xanthomonadales bacterium]
MLQRAAGVRMLALDVDGILTDGRIYYDSAGGESKAFNIRDGYGMKAVQRCGIQLALITGRESAMVGRRAAEIGIEHVYQGRDDKLNAYMELLAQTGLEDAAVCYAGDDWLDLPVLQRVGLAVTVPEAGPQVRERVHWVTRHAGGAGAVREICDLLLEAQGHLPKLLEGILGS